VSTLVQFQASEPHDTVYSVMSLACDTSIDGSSALMAAAVVDSWDSIIDIAGSRLVKFRQPELAIRDD